MIKPQSRQVQHRLRDPEITELVRAYEAGAIPDVRFSGVASQELHLTGLEPLAPLGVPLLRWALLEPARHAHRPTSPDHDYYLAVAARLDSKRATLAVARRRRHRRAAVGGTVRSR